MVDLLFAEGLGHTDLVFGEAGPAPIVAVLGSAVVQQAPALVGVLKSGALPLGAALAPAAIGSAWTITRVPKLSCAATTMAPIASLSIAYDNAVNRAPFRWAQAPYESAAPARTLTCRSVHHATRTWEAYSSVVIATAATRRAGASMRWQFMLPDRRPESLLSWGIADYLDTAVTEVFQPMLSHLRPSLFLPFGNAFPLPAAVSTDWRELLRWARPSMAMHWGTGARLAAIIVAPSRRGRPSSLAWRMPWQSARRPMHGVHIPIDPPGPDPHYVASSNLLFDDSMPSSRYLVFGRTHIARPNAKIVIPILRAYIVVNDVTLLRTDGSLQLPAIALSVSIDADSWVWGWQATLPATSLDDVLPSAPGAPVELEATINGANFLLLAEKVTRDRRFAQARITVSGRGIAAELGDPYSPAVNRNNATDLTAQQIMAAALTESGVGIGWSLDWRLTDWLVPAGVWSHTGTHIEAVTRIAEAAGGYVQASRNSRTLHILHRYPVAPWDWPGVDPDFSLPSAATTRESVEWLEKPPYNAVYVSGEGAGVLAQVQRAGTAGDWPAQMVTDALNTHSEAARQRGLAILADTGRQQLLTLETPVLTGVGIYPVGSFVAFSDGADSRLGIVRSVSVNAAFPTVRQTIEIECHE